jgi:hypothetical protein
MIHIRSRVPIPESDVGALNPHRMENWSHEPNVSKEPEIMDASSPNLIRNSFEQQRHGVVL